MRRPWGGEVEGRNPVSAFAGRPPSLPPRLSCCFLLANLTLFLFLRPLFLACFRQVHKSVLLICSPFRSLLGCRPLPLALLPPRPCLEEIEKAILHGQTSSSPTIFPNFPSPSCGIFFPSTSSPSTSPPSSAS